MNPVKRTVSIHRCRNPLRVHFEDAGFADGVVKVNAVQILRQAGIEDVKSL